MAQDISKKDIQKFFKSLTNNELKNIIKAFSLYEKFAKKERKKAKKSISKNFTNL